MNRKAKIALGAGLLLVLGAAAALWALHEHGNGNALTLYGNVDIREVELGFRVAGRVAAMDVDEGDAVRAGQVLARLDDQPYREALAVAAAEVQQATAGLDKLRRGSRPQEIQQARARLREAAAVLTNAEREFLRQEALVKTGATSHAAMDAARAARDQAAAARASAQEALALAQEGFRPEDIAAGQAQLAAAQAHLAQAQTQLADTELKAPSDAVVLTRAREPGSMVAQGATVYTLSLRKPVYVRAYVSEPELGKLAPGAAVTVATDSSAHRYHGQIGFISPRAEFTPKSVETTELRTDLVYRLRIVVADADSGLRQGMPVTVTVPLAAAPREH